MVGNEDWNSKTFLMVQEGSHSWSGRVVVWKGNSRSGAHGRRYNNRGETGQWESGDVIKLASCDIEGKKYFGNSVACTLFSYIKRYTIGLDIFYCYSSFY